MITSRAARLQRLAAAQQLGEVLGIHRRTRVRRAVTRRKAMVGGDDAR